MATAGVSIRMLRNFGILKILLCRPTRSLQYRTGPGEVSRTKTATNTINGNSNGIASRASTRSKDFFIPISCSDGSRRSYDLSNCVSIELAQMAPRRLARMPSHSCNARLLAASALALGRNAKASTDDSENPIGAGTTSKPTASKFATARGRCQA